MLARLLLNWVLLLAAFATPAAEFLAGGEPAPQIAASLVTFQPGTVYWERFGHNAILLRDAGDGEAITFNYGLFDFGQADFFLNFARGRMRYLVAPNTLDRDLPNYAVDGRWATEQSLRLTPAQAGQLREFLIWNVQPEHREYDYDYFLSNCATRVRDALDRALGGALRRQLEGLMTRSTYRSEALRLIAPETPLFLAMDAALGPRADQPIDRWALAFSPLELMVALRRVTVPGADGATQPLVSAERTLLPRTALADPAPAPPDLRLRFLGLGLVLASLLLTLYSLRAQAAARVAFALLASLLTLALALAGLALAGIWALTEHWAGWGNGNLLLFSPLALLLLPTLLQSMRRHWAPGRTATRLAGLLLLLALLECGLRLTPWMAQQNLHWCLLVVPALCALAACLGRQRGLAGAG